MPAFSLISYLLFVQNSGFIPSAELQKSADLFAIFSGVAYLAAFLFAPVGKSKHNWFTSRSHFSSRSIGLLIFTPLLGALTGYGFVQGSVNYALHNMSSEKSDSIVLNVTSADSSGRNPCRKSAWLDNGGFIWRRQVCGLSDEDAGRLQGGGQIKLEGSVSRYGVEVKIYSIVSAYRPALTHKHIPRFDTLSDLRNKEMSDGKR